MTIFGLWAIIFSAVTLALIVTVAVSTLFTTTKWYRRMMTKATERYMKDFGYFDEKEDE